MGGWAGPSHLPRGCAIGLVAKTPGREKVPQRQWEGGADMPRPLLAGRPVAHKLPGRHGSVLRAPPPTHSACCRHSPWWPSLHLTPRASRTVRCALHSQRTQLPAASAGLTAKAPRLSASAQGAPSAHPLALPHRSQGAETRDTYAPEVTHLLPWTGFCLPDGGERH